MTLTYPLGLLGLIGVPVLILIYIIKNRYTEQTVASTYIWNLSQRFLKRRKRESILAGLISLILQILIVVLISFAISQPVITLKNAARAYCFVLDGSGSMNIVQSGETRFDVAKNEINKIIDESVRGSEYTLIYASDTAETIFKNETDKDTVRQIVSEMSVGYVTPEITDALQIAQEYFNANPSVATYLVTDTDYKNHDNVNIINVSKSTKNYSLTNVTYGISGGKLKINGTAVSYGAKDELSVNLYFDGSDKIYASQTVTAGEAGEDFEFLCDRTAFTSFKVEIANADSLALDSVVTVFDVNYENISNALLVSDNPFFIRAALVSAGIANVELVSTYDYQGATGYGLYVFDTFMPETLPDDGAVWFFNPQGSLTGTNFNYQSEIDPPRDVATYADPDTSTLAKTLLEGVTCREFELKKYVKCGTSGRFTTLIYCDGNPLLFVGNNAYGNREVVFAFDLRDSAQFTLWGDFSTLVKNFIDYSFPTIIENTSYYCGETMQLNVVANVKDFRIETPNGNVVYPDSNVDVCEYKLTEVGVYSIVLVMKDKSERTINVFSAMPEEERQPIKQADAFSISGKAKESTLSGYFDPLIYIFILITLIAVADYGVYGYEQYQL